MWAGASGEALGSLTSDPVPNRCATLQAQPCFCLSCGRGQPPTTLHHTYVWKIVMLNGRVRIWGCPQRGTRCLGVSPLP